MEINFNVSGTLATIKPKFKFPIYSKGEISETFLQIGSSCKITTVLPRPILLRHELWRIPEEKYSRNPAASEVLVDCPSPTPSNTLRSWVADTRGFSLRNVLDKPENQSKASH